MKSIGPTWPPRGFRKTGLSGVEARKPDELPQKTTVGGDCTLPRQVLPNEACLIDFYHDGYKGGYQLYLLSDRRARFLVSAPDCQVELVTERTFPFDDLFFFEAKFSSDPAKIRISIDGHPQEQSAACVPQLGNDLHNYHRWLNRSHKGGKGLDLFVAEIAVYTT